MHPDEEQKQDQANFSQIISGFLDRIETRFREKETAHDVYLCGSLNALTLQTKIVFDIAEVIREIPHDHPVGLDKILDTIQSIQMDIDENVSQIRRHLGDMYDIH